MQKVKINWKKSVNMTVFPTPSTAISKLSSLMNVRSAACCGSTGDIWWWRPVRQLPVCWLGAGYPKICNTQAFEGGSLGLLCVLTQLIISLFYAFHFGRTEFLLLLHWQWDSVTASRWCCLFCCSAWYPNWHGIVESSWDYKLYALAKESRIIKIA